MKISQTINAKAHAWNTVDAKLFRAQSSCKINFYCITNCFCSTKKTVTSLLKTIMHHCKFN